MSFRTGIGRYLVSESCAEFQIIGNAAEVLLSFTEAVCELLQPCVHTAALTVHVACFNSCVHGGAPRRECAEDCGSEEEEAAVAVAATAEHLPLQPPQQQQDCRRRAAECETFRLQVPSERRQRWDTET